jgi:hypothetical protein
VLDWGLDLFGQDGGARAVRVRRSAVRIPSISERPRRRLEAVHMSPPGPGRAQEVATSSE